MSKKPVIVFEGIEGSGKSYHLKNVSRYFKKNKIEFIKLREPGGNPSSEKIRKLILDRKSNFNKITDLLLYSAARSENIKVLKKYYKKKIILIDDISEITAAQRNEAWSEVARRLAHEIKNPLTPIQLSAERIDHKFSKRLEKKDQTILSDITKTIVNQVDAIKKMVNEFTEYSRSPELTKSEINLVDLLNELVNLFLKEDLKIIFLLNC